MEFMFLIPFVVISAVCIGGYFMGRYAAEKHGKRLKQIEAVPGVKAAAVAKHVGRMAKMAGRVIAPAGTLKSPIDGLECVYYRLLVEEERQETRTDSKGRSRTVTVWVPIVNAAKMVPCGIEDADGAIEVSLIEADMMLEDGGKQSSGWFSDVSPEIRKLIEEEYDRDTSGDFWGKKNLRVSEQVLQVGEKFLVIGKVKLVRTSLGVRPRFVKGKEPLLVTHKNDEELKGHFKSAAWWGQVGMFAGAGCGAVTLALGLLVAGGMGYSRFIAGKPWIDIGGTATPADPVGAALAGLQSQDQRHRREAIAPLISGPKAPYAGRKAELKAGLLKLMDDPAKGVYEQAAAALPNWAEASDEPQLMRWLDDKRPEASKAAALALGKLQIDGALPKIQALFLNDPQGYFPALKEYGPKADVFAATHLFSINEGVRGHSAKLLEGHADVVTLAFDKAVEALDSPNRSGLAAAWLLKARLSDAQKARAASAVVALIEGKKPLPREAAELLGKYATKEHVATLAEGTKSPNDALRRHSLGGLLRLGDERGLPVLASRFPSDPDGTIKALKPYGEKGDAVLAQFLFDGNAGLRDKASAALKGSPNFDKMYAEGAKAALEGRDAGRQVRAMEWLAREPQGRQAEYLPAVAILLASKGAGVADAAAKLLTPAVTKDHIPDLAAALKVHSGGTRKTILDMLQKLADPAALPALADAFPAAPAEVGPVLKSFGEAGETHLAKHLFSGNAGVRKAAADALADSPRKDALAFDAAVAALNGPDYDPKVQALAWLGKAALTADQSKVAAAALVAAAGKGGRRLPEEPVLAAMSRNAVPEMVPTFIEGLKNKNSTPRKYALDGLARVGDDKACEALAGLLVVKGGDWKGASAALKKLKAPAEKALVALLKEKKYGTNTAAASEACNILGEIGGPDSLAVLDDIVKAKTKGVEPAAKKAATAIRGRKG